MAKISRKGALFITKGKRENIIKETVNYFNNEHDWNIGVITAEDILDFFLQEIWESIYNKGVEDSKTVIRQGLENLEIDLDVLINK